MGRRREVPIPALVPLRRGAGDAGGATATRGAAGAGGAQSAPLFVVTAGYGDLMALTHLARLLQGDFSVYALQPPVPLAAPGPEPAALVTAYTTALHAVQPVGPYRLVGYSTGGLAAFALAQALTAAGERVSFLGLIDAPCGGSRLFGWAHRAARGVAGGWLARSGGWLGRPGRVAARLLGDPGLAAHVDQLAGYRAARYGGVITAVLPEEPPWARRFQQVGRWRKVAGGGLEVVHVPGDHDTCLRPPHVQALAARLDRLLAAT